MENFNPISAIIGGLLIGISSTLLLLSNGRIAGISGIAGGLTKFRNNDTSWRIIFLVGLITGPAIYRTTGGSLEGIEIIDSIPIIIIAGFLTGVGTTMGNGCTSGHGICGLARLSPRSFIAVAIFLGFAILTYFVTRHVIGSLI